MKILFLDDMEIRHSAFTRNHIGHDIRQAFTAQEAIRMINANDFDVVFLDHDLAEEHYLKMSEGLSEEPTNDGYAHGTGMDVVDHIIQMEPEDRPKHVIVHSMNGVRGTEMTKRLKEAGIWCIHRPFNPNLRYVA